MARILVVDDDALVRATVASALQRVGHEIVEAQNGLEAMATIERTSLDLVISDIIMPEVDGIGLLLRLRKQHPSLRVIVISGGGRIHKSDFLRMATTLGADMSLAKPFTPEQLRKAVDTVLARKRPDGGAA